MTRAEHVLQLLKQGSYSKHDLARLTGLKMRDKAWSVAVIEGDIRKLKERVLIEQNDNLFTVIN